ncbi:MAG: PAS domain S-box protein [Gammaproteobacteria bacterium]|nr:PAS domain S-box protein [Gammaproteobacteria bacterium]
MVAGQHATGTELSSAVYQSVLDGMRTSMLIVAASGEVLAANRAWHQLPTLHRTLPLRVDVGDNLLELGTKDTISASAFCRRLLRGLEAVLSGSRERVTLQPSPNDGPPHFRWRLSAIVQHERRYAILARSNVSREFGARIRMTHSLSLFRNMFEAAPDGVLLVTADGRIHEANSEACRQFGYIREELIGLEVEQLIPPSLRARHAGLRQSFLREGSARPMALGNMKDLLARRRDGSAFSVEVGLSPLTDMEPVSTLALIRDVSKHRERMRQQLDYEKLETLRLLAGGVAHDFNNLLTLIMGTAELALAGEKQDTTRSLLQDIMEASQQAADLTAQLQSFARKDIDEPALIDVAATLRADARILQMLTGPAVQLLTDIQASELPVLMDPTRFNQVLMNLAVNAGQAMEGRGRLTFCARAIEISNASWVEISVRDTGPGIDEATLARIFDPYFTTKGAGSGLGLPTVREIIREAGGTITCTSRPGAGSEFIIRLPRA